MIVTLTVTDCLQFTKGLHRIAENRQRSEEFREIMRFSRVFV